MTATTTRPVHDLAEALKVIPGLSGWEMSQTASGGWMVSTPQGTVRVARTADWTADNAARTLQRLHAKGLATPTTSPAKKTATKTPAATRSATRGGRRRRGAGIAGYEGDAFQQEGQVSSEVDLTPELAQHFLGRDWDAVTSDGTVLRQRPTDPEHVDYFVELIEKGRFTSTYQGLGIGLNGSLYDGRHRCLAVVKTGRAVRVKVTYNVAPDEVMALDSGKARRAATKLGMTGYDHPLQLGSAARLVRYFCDYEAAEPEARADWRKWHNTKVTDTAIDEVVQEHDGLPDAVEWAVEHRQLARDGLNQSAVGAFRYLVLRAGGEPVTDKLETFLAAVVDNVGIDSRDHVAKVVQRWRERDQSRHRRYLREAHLYVLVKAWNAYIEGRHLKRLPDDLPGAFPLPATGE